MKKIIALSIAAIFMYTCIQAQDSGNESKKDWQISADANFYFIPDDFFVLPVFRADKNKLHLEARYNYEDRETFSAWAGYNFSGGNKFEFAITPMIGAVAGNLNGLAPGIEMSFAYKSFELYSESEYFFDVEVNENDFYYNWTDLYYFPTDNFWLGLSAQRTRLYQTDLDIQRGFFAGGSFKKWELSGYLYNLFFDDPFVLATVSYNF